MDKLRPIIENKFWIFFGVAIILPVVGWWPTSNEKVQEIDNQTKAIDQSFTTATKDRSKVANDQWLAEINKVIKEKKEKLEIAKYEIAKKQQKYYVWPDEFIANELKKYPRITSRNYKFVDKRVPYAYTKFYPKEIKKLYESLNPYKAIGTGDENLKESGIIAVRGGENVFPTFDYSDWDKNAPNMLVVWEAQEDLWFLSSIVDAINKMNEGSVSIADSTIKVIVDIDFMGGQGRGQKQPTNEASNNSQEPDLASDNNSKTFNDTNGNEYTDLPLDFHPGEVFGLQQGTTEAQNTGRRRMGGNAFSGGGDDDSYSKKRKGPVGLGTYTKSTRRSHEGANRYVDLYAKTAPYYSRGFHLHLIMDHRKIPQFVEELSKSPWLIQVLRYQYQNARAVGDLDLIVPIAELTEETNQNGSNSSRKKRNSGIRRRGGGFGSSEDEDYENVRGEKNKPKDKTPQQRIVREKTNGYELALTDPYQAEVFISGKFHIYFPVKAPEGYEANEDTTEVANAETDVSQENTETTEEEPSSEEEATEPEGDNNNTDEEKPDSTVTLNVQDSN